MQSACPALISAPSQDHFACVKALFPLKADPSFVRQLKSFVQAQEACAIAWATNQQILAVGTSKGNLVLYNLARYQKVPIMGKHTRAVSCAAWNNTEILAMGATDKQVQYVVLSPANASHVANGRHV